MFTRLLLVLATLASGQARADASVATNAAELAAAIRTGSRTVERYDISGTVTRCAYRFGFYRALIKDASGHVSVCSGKFKTCPDIRPGDFIRSTGIIQHHPRNMTGCEIRTLERHSSGPPSAPETVSLAEVASGRFDYHFVQTAGRVRDAFIDDIDPRFAVILLTDGSALLNMSMAADILPDLPLSELIGATVSVRGYASTDFMCNRALINRSFYSFESEDLEILEHAPADPFAAAVDAADLPRQPEKLAEADLVRVRGLVVARWASRRLLVKTADIEFSSVEIDQNDLPAVGDFIEAVGRPSTDLNYVNLYRARWRRTEPLPISEEPVKSLTIGQIIGYPGGSRTIDPHENGNPVRIEGEVVEMNHRDGTLALGCEGEIVTVHLPDGVSAEPRSRISATGICLLVTQSWSPHAPFPRVSGFELILRRPDDLTVLAAPPWWTPSRVFALVLSLVLALAAAVLGNVLLKRLVDRRGRELASAEIEQVKSQFAVGERTRLAVELHDSISQNLTAVGLEIDASRGFFERKPEAALRHLDAAGRTLQSCRNELRNCLWDLRNHTLELEDFAEAIRQTLVQHIGNATIRIRFQVPREAFSDNTAHNLLRILRELASNSVRHGHAAEIRIAGAFENGCLLVSVKDDGEGFDPDRAPGVTEGHFGLEGIRERVESQSGEFSVESEPGKGCRAMIRIPLKKETT